MAIEGSEKDAASSANGQNSAGSAFTPGVKTAASAQAAEVYSLDERRRTLRTAARFKGRIEMSGYSFPVMTWDVSMGGARCSVQGVFPPDTGCTLFLTDDKGNEMPIPSKVVRSSGFDTRLRFLDMKPKQKDFLTRLTNRFGS